MTIVDVFMLWPSWVRYVVLLILLIFAVEAFLAPFKINMTYGTLKRIEALLEQLNTKIEANKKIDMDYQKMVALMQTLLGKEKN